MDSFIQRIIDSITSETHLISVVNNPDGFLSRPDTQEKILKESGLLLLPIESSIELRVRFELSDKNSGNKVCYIYDDVESILPDIMMHIYVAPTFKISKLLPACNEIVLLKAKNLTFNIASYIYKKKFTNTLTAQETIKLLEETDSIYGTDEETLKKELTRIPLKWEKVETIEKISYLLLSAIKNNLYGNIVPVLETINEDFQKFIDSKYASMINSSAIQRPKMVHKILPNILHQHSRTDKVALVVIDGMSYWQYLLLKRELSFLEIETDDNQILSWIPSITKLSRQAIFRGESPVIEYNQSPKSESSLWIDFWTSSKQKAAKRLQTYEVGYIHGSLCLDNMQYRRIALVDTDLDEKMHSSSCNKELYLLTENWVHDTAKDIKELHENGYHVYITTDHGNVYTSPWRNLTSQEKTFLFEKESRGKRHLIYSKKEYLDRFISSNNDIENQLLRTDKWTNNSAVWRNLYSFNNNECITHGGSHFLEVVIPFITIKKK